MYVAQCQVHERAVKNVCRKLDRVRRNCIRKAEMWAFNEMHDCLESYREKQHNFISLKELHYTSDVVAVRHMPLSDIPKLFWTWKNTFFSVVPFCIFTLFSQFLSFRFKFQDRRRSHKLQKYADDLHFHFMVFILIFFFFSRCRSFLTTTTTTTCPATTNFIR